MSGSAISREESREAEARFNLLTGSSFNFLPPKSPLRLITLYAVYRLSSVHGYVESVRKIFSPLFSAIFPLASSSGLPRMKKKARRRRTNERTNRERKNLVERNGAKRVIGETTDGQGVGSWRGIESVGVGDPDVLIKRLIFIARQKREFNAHRRLMRRPTAARTLLAESG